MKYEKISGVPDFESYELLPKQSDHCLMIPVLNEKGRIEVELERAIKNHVDEFCDIIILDGGSTDEGVNLDNLNRLGVNTLLVKTGAGKQGAQLRMGFYYAKKRGYIGFITVDGNNKDSIEKAPSFVEKLNDGYDFIQGSRYLPDGGAENTPFIRNIAVRIIHAPMISKAAKYKFTDTTNSFRGYSLKYITHPDLDLFRDVFSGYELLAYMSVRAGQLGLKITEIPVMRNYPPKGRAPTKISPVRGSFDLLKILLKAVSGKYNPRDDEK